MKDLARGPLHWSDVPEQESGTAAGKSHEEPAAATRAAGKGAGRKRGRGRGALPDAKTYSRNAKTGQSQSTAGFVAKTSKRLASKSSATTTVFANADGSTTKQIAQEPVNYNDGNSWEPIDTTVEQAADGRWQEKANSVSVSFAEQAADKGLVELAADGGHAVSYDLQGAAPVTGSASESTVTYESVLPHTDLEVAPTATGVKEAVVLDSADAANSWTFPLHLTGLTPVLKKNGTVELQDRSGTSVEEIPPAYAFDSKVDPASGDPATTHAVSYELKDQGGTPSLVVTLDLDWLHSPDRVFPVTVDPTMTDTWTTTYAESGEPGDHSSEQTIKVGSYDSGTHSAASYIGHWYKSVDGSNVNVTAASLKLFDTWASTCTPQRFDVAAVTSDWTPSSVTSYPGPAYGASIGNLTPSVPTACANTASDRSVGDWVTVPLSTTTFNGWASGSTKDYGLAVYAATNDTVHWKQFGSFNDPKRQPVLSLTYTGEVPPQIYQQYPQSGAVLGSTTPEFSAVGFSPSGATLKYDFQVFDTAGTKVLDSGLVASQNWTPAAGKLVWGQTYYWTVQANDGTASSAAPAWSSLTLQPQQPLITSDLSQNDDDHGFDPAIQNYTTSDTDADISTAGPALQVVRDYNSRDPRWSAAFGAGWSSVFDAQVREQLNGAGAVTGVVVTYPDGSEVGYGKNSDGTFAAGSGRFATVKATTGGYTLTDKEATTYTFAQALSTGTYGITSISDASARALTMNWAAGHIATLTSSTSGRALKLAWTTPSGASTAHVSTVTTDPATAGDSTTAQVWRYGYTGDQLSSVCSPLDTTHCTKYAYTAGSQYRNAALDLDPRSFWPLGETSGTAAASSVIANEGADVATYRNVTLGQPGPLAGSTTTATGFDGTSSAVTLPNSLANTADAQAISMWFKTSTPDGVLFSYNSQPVDTATLAGYYTPSIYVGSDGKLNAEFWYSGNTHPIVTSNAVTDGQWHHLVLSAAGSSQTLYLDGASVGSVAGQVSVSGNVFGENQDFTTIGAGYIGGHWPDQAHQDDTGNNTGYATYFKGSIAGVGYYDRNVNAAEVAGLYAAGTHPAALLSSIIRPSGKTYATISYDPASAAVTKVVDENGGTWSLKAPTVAGSSQVYRGSVLGSDPDGYWRLGDTTGASVAADEIAGGPATYNAVTLGATGPFADQPAATFNGTSSSLQLPTADQVTTGPGSVETWFKVPAGNTAGGVLYSQMSASLTTSGATSTPALYVGTDGKVHGGFWTNNVAATMATSKTVNDGAWHHVVLAASTNSQAIYLDGVQQATESNALVAQPTTYAYVGAGAIGTSWPAHPTSTLGYFTGSIAETVFYRHQLTGQDAAAHFQAAHDSHGLTPLETVQVTDPTNATLSYQFDPSNGNRAVSTTDALGHKTSFGYDTGGFEHTVTDPNGDVTVSDHDPRGNVVSTSTCQNQAGNVCSTHYYSYFPDDTSAQLTTADPRNDLLLTSRDGRSSSASDNTYLTSYSFDSRGNQTGETTPPVAGSSKGRTTTTTYSDGTATYPAADSGNVPVGLPVKTVTPAGSVSSVAYLRNGDVASTTDPGGLVTRYTYDGLGQVLTKTEVSDSYPNGVATSYGYDRNGQVTRVADPALTDRVTGAKHTPITSTVYDSDGNPTSQTVADGTGGDAPRTVSWTYNDHGQQASEVGANANTDSNVNGTTTYGYDLYGNKTSETTPTGTTTAYGYDAEGNVTSQTLKGYIGDPITPSTAKDLVEASRAYDPDDRLASLTDAMGNTTRYTYLDDGLVSSITKTDKAGSNPYVVEADTYDAEGNLTKQVTDNGANTTTFAVDAASRTTTTTVDPTGVNRTTQVSYTPDDLIASTTERDDSGYDRVTTNGYDKNGNLTAETVYGDSAAHPSGWWKLDQSTGTTVTDATGSGNTASLGSGVTWSGGTATFDGTAGEQLATNAPVIDTAGSYSTSMWVNLGAANVASTQAVLSAMGTSTTATTIAYTPSTKAWQLRLTSKDATPPAVTTVTSAANSAPVGTWVHVAATYDSGTGAAALYVNGAQAATGTFTSPWHSTGALVMGEGENAGHFVDPFAGQLGNVQVYPRALTAAEISKLYSGGQNSGTVGSSNQQTTKHTYDQRGLLTSTTDPNTQTTTYTNDEAGNLVLTSSPAVSAETNGAAGVTSHPTTTSGFDTFGEAVEEVDPNGNQTRTGYDADGNKVTETQPGYTAPGSSTPVNTTTTWTYDGDGQATSMTLPGGETSSYRYDQTGQLAQTTQPDQSTVRSIYDPNGDVLATIDANGSQAQATYDHLGRPLTKTLLERFPSTKTLTTKYSYAASTTNPGGANLATETSPEGRVTTYGYDHVGQELTVTDGASNTTRYGYDFNGNVTKAVQPDGTFQQTDYNTAEQPVAQRSYDASSALLTTTKNVYDGNGNLTAATDANGHTSTFTYDASNMLTQEVQPTSSTHSVTTSFGYDAAGNRTRYTDGRGNKWLTTYNSWNQPATVVEPGTAQHGSAAESTTTYAYNGDGQVTSLTQPGAVTLTMTYDKLGNLTQQTGTGAEAATATRKFTYDPDGQVLTASTAAAGVAGQADQQAATSETFSYNDRGGLTSASGSAGSSSFGYSDDGLVASRTDAAGTTTYGYDNDGRVSSMKDPATGTSLTYTYNKVSQTDTIQYGATGQTRNYTYDGLHQLKSDTLTQGSSTAAAITYGYDKNGNLTSKATTGVAGASSNTYGYDWADRLTSWTSGSTTTQYGYDDSGNRTQVGANTYTYDARDELTSDGANTYAYSARGTMTSANGAAGNNPMASDAFGNQIVAGTQHYGIDATGRVITDTTTAGQSVRTLAYSGAQNQVVKDGSYTYGYDPSGGLVGINLDGATDTTRAQLAMTDQHDDVVGTFKAGATTLAGSTSWDPIGAVTASSSKFGFLGYQTGWTDQATNKVNMGSRWFNPATGQFMNKDTLAQSPVPNAAAANPFAYVSDNPLGDTDPTGHCGAFSFGCWKAAASNFVHHVSSSASHVYHAAAHAVHRVARAAAHVYHKAAHVARSVVHHAKRAVSKIVHHVRDAYHAGTRWVRHVAKRAWHAAVHTWHAVKRVYHKATHAVRTAYHKAAHATKRIVHKAANSRVGKAARTAYKAEVRGAKAIGKFVEHHKAAIVSFAASTAVFLGCEALTAGAGTIGCAVAAGAVYNLVDQGFKCHDGGGAACSAGAFATAGAEGAAEGLVGGQLGAVGGRVIGAVAPKAISLMRAGAPKAMEAVGGLFSRLSAGASRTGAASVGRAPEAAVADTVAPALRPLTSDEETTLADALRPDKQDHLFDPKHKFEPLLRQHGSREAVTEHLVRNLGGPLPAKGPFEINQMISGQPVTIRGAVVNGIPRIGTAFTP